MKKISSKRLSVLSALGMLSVFGSISSNTDVLVHAAELPSSVTNVIKVTIDTTSQAYLDAVSGLEDDAYVNYATGFLPIGGASDSEHPFKDNFYTDWWNPWTDVTVSWDFYTPHFMAGMNGVGLRYEWAFVDHDKTADQNGYKATSRDADYVAQYSNGWVHREVSFDVNELGKNMIDMWFTQSILKSELDAAGVVDMYYSNIKISYGGNTFDVFGNSSSHYTPEQINKVAAGEPAVEGNITKTFIALDNWDDVKTMTGEGKSRAVTGGLTYKGITKVPYVSENQTKELEMETKDSICLTIDATSQMYLDEVEGLNDDDYIMYGTSLLPLTGASDQKYAFKNSALGDWWNPWTDITISYDFFTDKYLSGMNGLGVQYENSWIFSNNADLIDQNGYTAISRDAEYMAQYSNGWVHREIAIPAKEGNFIPDMWFVQAIEKSLLDEAGVVNMYITNITLSYNNNTYDLFGGEHSLFTVENINSVAAGEATDLGKPVKMDSIIRNSSWDDLKSMSGESRSKACTNGLTFSASHKTPKVSPISNSFPNTFVMNADYDLASLINCDDKFEIISVKNSAGEVDLTDKNFSNFAFDTIGKNYVTVRSKDGNFEMQTTFEALVVDPQTPLFFDADLDAAVPSQAFAHEPITINNVYAQINGEKTLLATPTVVNSNGDSYELTEVENGFTFIPTVKVNDTYIVTYRAVNGDYVVDSKEMTITVTDIDKPVINFDDFNGLAIGTNYTVDEIKSMISITDISDGTIEVESISIIDPLGNELITDENKFMAKYSGEYTITVVSKTDSDGNFETAVIRVDGQKSQGLVLGIISNVPEDLRAEGVKKDLNVQIWHPDDIVFNVGDVLTYEIMAYTVYADGSVAFIPGLGAISGQIDGDYAGLSWPMMHLLFANVESKDADGNSMARTADLTDYLSKNGSPVWYSRSYTVKSGDGIFGAKLYHLTLALETEAECGTQIIVYYKNIKLCDADGNEKVILWNGSQAINKEFIEGNLNSCSYVVATVDVSPVPITGKIASTAIFNEEFSFSKVLMKNAQTDEVLNSTVTVIGPDGQPVDVEEGTTSFTFIPTKLGTYLIKVSATNNLYTTEITYNVLVSDLTKPVVNITTDKETYYVGDTAEISITMSDDVVSFEQFKEKGYTVRLNGEIVEVDFEVTANGYKGSLALEEGEYTILVYCTDSVNETVESITITVGTKTTESVVDPSVESSNTSETEEPAKKGCKSSIESSSLIVLVLLCGAAILCLRKRKLLK